MKKILFLIAIFIVSLPTVFSQDILIKKTGDEIKTKVIEVGVSEIKYKKFESPTGPTYSILKSDVFMIKYEDGNKDVFSGNDVQKQTPAASKVEIKEEKTSTSANQNSTMNYVDKVREVQKNDPSFGLYFGNGFLNGPGYSNPVLGFDIRFSRKNVFLSGLTIGFRAGFKNAVYYGEYASFKEIYGFSIAAKYYAPIPITKIQPYLITHFGLAYQFDYYFSGEYTASGNMMHDYTNGLAPFIGFGVGSNFMLARRFGFFLEAGYFSASLINLGIIFKL
jgi:hypothetical protein